MLPNTAVLFGFAALKHATFSDVMKNIGPHFWPTKVGSQIMEGLVGS